MIRILLSDDHAIVRRGLGAVLEAHADIEVVGEAATAQEALAAARRLHPDVVLLDLQYGGGAERGSAVIAPLHALSPSPAVLVLTTYDNDQDVTEAMEAGADGYLLKDSEPETILEAVRRAAAGSGTVDPRLARRRDQDSPERLTARERDVLALVADGRTNAQIATELFLSQATVKTHLVHVFEKLRVTSRTEAVAAARRLGILRPEA